MFKSVIIHSALGALCLMAPPAIADDVQVAQWASGAETPSASTQPASREIQAVQRLLQRGGYYSGPINGVRDRATEQAVERFGMAEQLPTVSLQGPELLRALFRTLWRSEGWAQGRVDGQDTIISSEQVKEAQSILASLGYAPGPADGVFGPATLIAMESFQSDLGLHSNGLLTRNAYYTLLRESKLRTNKANGVVRMYNWPDYIDYSILEQFESETKIKVLYEVYETTEQLEGWLNEKETRADIVVYSGSQMNAEIVRGGFQKIDKSKVPNYKNLSPEILVFTTAWDKNNDYNIPYSWGTVGVAYNRAAVRKVSPISNIDYLAAVFDPRQAQTYAKCGIALIDEAPDIIHAALAYLKLDPASTDPAVINQALPVLTAIRGYVNTVDNVKFINNLADGKYCLAVGYSGDVLQAQQAAQERKSGVDIVYNVPTDGAELWFDVLTIPAGARNTGNAYKLIDFILEPKNSAAITNETNYPSANAKSVPFIRKELLDNKTLYPPPSVLSKLYVPTNLTPAGRAAVEDVWQKFKNAK
ncbi:extracellular solute-binding protein [Asticcacaulis sp.]|uniref:extracellular solute-binding protein n=1 Tax=Asticcacaulis sp. TaxID=1872648 RepID=UPI002637ABC8|nr:extracellular solute-binding protein [Asticcacaulis sp.]